MTQDTHRHRYIEFVADALIKLRENVSPALCLAIDSGDIALIPTKHLKENPVLGTREDIMEALVEGVAINYFSQFTPYRAAYLEMLFQAPAAVFSYFISHEKNAFPTINEINPFLHHLTHAQVWELFTNDNLSIPWLGEDGFDECLENLKNLGYGKDLVLAYACKKCQSQLSKAQNFTMRDSLIRAFPKDLEYFREIPGMDFFLDGQYCFERPFLLQGNSFEPGYCILLELDYYALRKKYIDLPFGICDYDFLLSKLSHVINSMRDLDHHPWRICEATTSASVLNQPAYDHYKGLSIYLHEDSSLTLEYVQDMIVALFDEAQHLMTIELSDDLQERAEQLDDVENFISKWMEGYVLKQQLRAGGGSKKHKL